MAAASVGRDAILKHFDSSIYELEEKIGEGGFGSVYRAKQINTGQIVAIKFLSLREDFAEDKKQRYIERFERETQLCSRLQHPNIVRLLDKGCCNNNLLYAVFEYVDGKTLKETLIDQGYLTAVETADVMLQVLDALAHAHEQGVIHRDVKPANIMLTRAGARTHVKVLDFGIGTLVDEARQLDYKSITLSQETLGTPSYSAPEQLRGEPPTVKTDIYVWGLVFIECLIGKPAVTGGNLASVFHKQLSQSNVPLPAAVAAHPVSSLLRRALHKKTHERTITATELYSELSQMNFSNLVGDLAKDFRTNQSTESDDLDFDSTQINENTLQLTELTERKQLTAMAVCLQVRKNTADDQNSEIIDALHHDQKNQCVDTAIRYGAYHVGTLGDTMLFYFGYPSVSDNDTRLAARAALDMSSEINKRNSLLRHSQKVSSEIRVGIHTGLVTAYADSAPEGDTPNTALELARVADAGQILCSDSSMKSLEAYIEFEADKVRVIGVNSHESATWSMTGERQVEAFGFLRGARRSNAFVGRDHELHRLKDILNSDEDSQIRLAHIWGEAGIGKSRLVFEMREQVKNFQHLVAQCLPEHKNNALYPILNLLRYKYSLETLAEEEAAALLVHKVSTLCSENGSELEAGLPVLFAWLNFPLTENMSPSAHTPDVQKKLLFNIIIALLVDKKESTKSKYLYIFEDMHWSDPTSIEFIADFTETIKSSDDAFLSTSREVIPDKLKHIGFEPVAVEKLSAQSVDDFVSISFGGEPVANRVKAFLEERTDGIPLFIEELVDMLKHKQLVEKLNGIYDFINPDMLNELPVTLRDSLQQKLDSLIYAKETAQLAATIGREFDYNLLVAASGRSESQIQNDLNELLEADLILQQRKIGGDSYIFKHALVRGAAYESMTHSFKKGCHLNIVNSIESHFPELIKNSPVLLAMHSEQAEDYKRASSYGILLSKKMLALSQNFDAVRASYKSIELSDLITNESDKLEHKIYSYETLLPSLMTTKGYGADELASAVESINQLVEEWKEKISDDVSQWDELLDKNSWIQFLVYHYRSERGKARTLGENLLKKAREEGDIKREMTILGHLAQARQIDGDFKTALIEYEKAIELYDTLDDPEFGLEYGIHVKAQAIAMSSFCYYYAGNVEKARDLILESINYSEEIKHDPSIVFSYLHIALYYSFLNESENVKLYAKAYYDRHGKSREEVWHTIFIDLLNACAEKNTQQAQKYFDEMIDSGQDFVATLYAPFLSFSYIADGMADKALSVAKENLEKSKMIDMKSAYAPLNFTIGVCLYEKNNNKYNEEVDFYLSEAVKEARDQDAVYLELDFLSSKALLSDNFTETNRLQDILDTKSVSVGSPAYQRAVSILNK